jgi:hypothetical protein
MDSLTMERDKRELGPAHEQGAGLEHAHTKSAIHSEIDLAERDDHADEIIEEEHKHVESMLTIQIFQRLSLPNSLKSFPGKTILKKLNPLCGR